MKDDKTRKLDLIKFLEILIDAHERLGTVNEELFESAIGINDF